jgi:RNA polymerase sigma factor (sigma-70 family)
VTAKDTWSQAPDCWVNPAVEDDRELVIDLRARKPGAFDRMYHRYHERVWRFLARLAGPGADDLFQDTWLAAARHVHRLRPETSLLPWLFTIARNKHRNATRSWARQRRQSALVADGGQQPVPDEAAHARRQAEQTLAAFARLPDAYREVLLLCVMEEMDALGAGLVLECSADAVRKRLSRARQEQACLTGRHPEGKQP